MINYKVTVTRKADTDEAAIFKYISDEFGKIYADRFREKLLHFFHLLSKQPFLGRPAKNNPALRVYIFSKQNKIIYKVNSEEIIIIRLLHTKTNLASNFKSSHGCSHQRVNKRIRIPGQKNSVNSEIL